MLRTCVCNHKVMNKMKNDNNTINRLKIITAKYKFKAVQTTDLKKDKGVIRCLGGVGFPCLPVAPTVCYFKNGRNCNQSGV